MTARPHVDPVLEDAWKELLGFYKKGYDFLNEEDMRCLLYHLCAKRSNEINYVHAQKRIEERTQRKHDLVVNDSLNKHRIAIELKCWLWKSSGTPNRSDVIKEQLIRLNDAVESKKYDLAYLFVLDEFGQGMIEDGSLSKVHPISENVHLRHFAPLCLKSERWSFDENSQKCQNCTTETPCQLGQEYLKKWQSKGFMK